MHAHRSPARQLAASVLLALSTHAPAFAADQTQTGAGNAAALRLAHKSPLVQSALAYLRTQAGRIQDPPLRAATLDILQNPKTCVVHRRGLATVQAQDAVIQTLFEQGLIDRDDAAAFPSGLRAAVFPPILQADTDCPQLPQPLESAPGSVFGGHHSYPGGLPVHEANNARSDVNLAGQYQASYGNSGKGGLPQVRVDAGRAHGSRRGDLPIDLDVIIAAPIWHDWAKTIVFQWNDDGSEFTEFNFGGAGLRDAWGAAGDSRTAAHHILSVAEAMARGLSPLMVVTQASAHAAPALGNEFKVVNWLRAAAVIARVDPVQAGYLSTDASGHLRLPPLGTLGDFDLNAAGQSRLRLEYALHNLSDADYTFSAPAIGSVDVLLAALASEFGYDASERTAFNTRFRNPVLSYLSAERLLTIYGTKGLEAVRHELERLRRSGVM